MTTRTEEYRVQTLRELTGQRELEMLQQALVADWGPFAPANMDEMHRMVQNAGHMMYVIRFSENGVPGDASGILQTGLADIHGYPQKLLEIYPTFNDITSNGTWEGAKDMSGDTALLLQITALGGRQRAGALLRTAALRMLPESVRYALTTSPFDSTFNPVILTTPVNKDRSVLNHYTDVMKFHYMAGAEPTGYREGYKVPDPSRPNMGKGRYSSTSVVFMRYIRLDSGMWKGR